MAKRAANNMGTVRKRSDGRWEGRYTAPDGRQHSVYAKTAAACTEALRAAQSDVDSGAWREPSNMTVAEWLDVWLKDYQTHTSERTVYKYRSIVKRFNKSIGNIKVSKLMPMHVRRMMKDMESEGLTAATIENYCRVFRTAMNRAVEANLIKENPAEKVKPPRPTPHQFCVIDREDIPKFLNEIKDTKYENEYIVMLLTGLRIGEIRGLKWSDIDINNGTIHIQRQLQPKIRGMQRFTPPKYGELRTLHVPIEVMYALKEQRRKQAKERLVWGEKWHEDEATADLVFRQKNGRPHSRGTLDRELAKVGKRIGKPELKPHDLRHSYAIAALRSGANVKTVQYNLGHKTSKMTLDTYAKYTEDTGRNDAVKLSNYLRDNIN